MEDVNANEKFYRLPQNLPGTTTNPGTIRNGDLMAYGGNGLVLFYKTFPTSYSYARIGTVDNPSGLESAMGSGTVTITFGETPEAHMPTLTYHINGADQGSVPKAVTEEEGTVVTLNDGAGFNRTGFTFAGWNTAANGSGTDYSAGSNYTLTNDIIIYAKWTPVSDSNTVKITVGSSAFTATLASNATATAFKQMLPLNINMSELNNNEKYYNLPNSLPTNSSNPGTIQNGDLMLYGSSTLVLFYKSFSTSYSYTRIGSVDNPSGLQSALGEGSVTVSFELQ
jgi:Listeria/Bacterioides repeat